MAGCWVLRTGRDPWGWTSLTEAPDQPHEHKGQVSARSPGPGSPEQKRLEGKGTGQPSHTDALGPAGCCRVGRVLCFLTPTVGADTQQALINTSAGQPLAATHQGPTLVFEEFCKLSSVLTEFCEKTRSAPGTSFDHFKVFGFFETEALGGFGALEGHDHIH